MMGKKPKGETLDAIMDDVKFSHQWVEDTENGGWTLIIPQLDIYGQGDTQEQAIEDAIKAAKEYAQVYAEDATLYFQVGRRHHYRYVLRILLAVSRHEDLRAVLGL